MANFAYKFPRKENAEATLAKATTNILVCFHKDKNKRLFSKSDDFTLKSKQESSSELLIFRHQAKLLKLSLGYYLQSLRSPFLFFLVFIKGFDEGEKLGLFIDRSSISNTSTEDGSVLKVLAKELGFCVAWAHLGPHFLEGFPNCAAAATFPGVTSLNQDKLGTMWQDGGGSAAQTKA